MLNLWLCILEPCISTVQKMVLTLGPIEKKIYQWLAKDRHKRENSFGEYCKDNIINNAMIVDNFSPYFTNGISGVIFRLSVLCSQPFESQMGLKLQNRCLGVKLSLFHYSLWPKSVKVDFKQQLYDFFLNYDRSFLTADGMTVHLSVNVDIEVHV